jgi:hypothetical protein
MSNIHADLIKNATNMQSQLLEFSHQLSNLSLKSLDDQNAFKVSEVIINDATGSPTFTVGSSPSVQTYSQVKITFSTTPSVAVFVGIGDNGIPAYVSTSTIQNGAGTPATVINPTANLTAQQTVATSMAVVAMNLRGVGVGKDDIVEIFKNGITPTSLAAVESQLKGHHDAVLQLSLESLSRVTNILQKIAQKLGS